MGFRQCLHGLEDAVKYLYIYEK